MWVKLGSWLVLCVLISGLVACGGGSSTGGGGSPTLNSITLTPDGSTIAFGAAMQLTATGHYSDGSTRAITSGLTWNSSAPDVATVDASGHVATLKHGTTTISATKSSVSGQTTVTITTELLGVSLGPIGPGIVVAGQQQFTATGSFDDGSTQDLTASATWASSDLTLASVSPAGLGVGLAVGPVTISATSGAVTGSTALNVVATPYSCSPGPCMNGNYVFTLMSADTRGPQLFVGSFHANAPNGSGNGTIDSGVVDSNTSAGVSNAALSGSYKLYADGRGTITFNSNSVFANGIQLRFILSTSGNLGKLAQFDGIGTAKGSFEPQTASAINGTYVFRTSGIDAAHNPLGQVGIMTAASGVVTGTVDTNDFSVVTAMKAITNTSSVSPLDTNGRGTLHLVTDAGATNYAVYSVTANKFHLMQTDTGAATAVAGVAEMQTNTAYTAASIAGPYAFLVDRPVVVGTGGNADRTEFAQVGVYTFDGVSALTDASLRDDTNNSDPLNPNPLTVAGGYNVSTSGINGRGTITTLAADSNRAYVYYMVSSTKAYMLQTFTSPNNGSLNAPTGEMDRQSSPFSGNTLTGVYSLDASRLTSSYTEALVWLTFDGLGDIAGIADVSQAGNVSSAVVNASYHLNTDPQTGRGDIKLVTPAGANDYIFYLVSPQSAWILGVSPPLDGSLTLQ